MAAATAARRMTATDAKIRRKSLVFNEADTISTPALTACVWVWSYHHGGWFPMRSGRLMLLIVALSLAGAGLSLRAHHAEVAEYDSTKPVKVSGTLARYEWS